MSDELNKEIRTLKMQIAKLQNLILQNLNFNKISKNLQKLLHFLRKTAKF